MSHEGFKSLVMGFTGQKVLRWLVYIAAFNHIEAELQKPAYNPQSILFNHLVAQADA